MVRCFLLLAACLASTLHAAEPVAAKRDRDAAAVLALEMELSKPKPASKLLSYAEAYTTAIADGKPMIAYPVTVSRPVCPSGAVCAKADGDKIIVGYPKGDDIIVVERLAPDAPSADVLKAFEKAKKQVTPTTAKDPFFISLTLPLAIAAPPACTCAGKLPCECGESCRCVAVEPIQFAQPCPGGVCPAPAKPATVPMPMAGPGPVTKGFTVERPRLIRRTGGLVGRFFFPWRR